MMRIILIAGKSGSGKTTISKELCKDKSSYNFINSYTDRPKRTFDEWGHTFIDKVTMDKIYNGDDVVAKTNINGYRYCATLSQFTEHRINVYIVDAKGIDDIKASLPMADFLTVLIERDIIDSISKDRLERCVALPKGKNIDYTIQNIEDINTSAMMLQILVNYKW